MYITNSDILTKIPCYITDEKLARYLIMKKKMSVLSIQNGKYYFRKNESTDRIFKGEIPFYLKWCKYEQTGGEEN